MIIKSTSRKDREFDQIIAYLHKEGEVGEAAITYVHNMDVLPDDLKGMIEALKQNDSYRRLRKNSIGFYHDIISFSPEDSAAIRQNPGLLRDLVEQYVRLRCPHALAVARVHIEEDHIHIHVVISANERESGKSVRISRADFAKIKDRLRSYQQEQYPELQYSYRGRGEGLRSVEHVTDVSRRMNKQGRRQSRKVSVAQKLVAALSTAKNPAQFLKHLKEHQLQVYQLRQQWRGLIHQGRKYRFSTLLGALTELLPEKAIYLLKCIDQLDRQQYSQGLAPEQQTLLQMAEDLKRMQTNRSDVDRDREEKER